MTLRKKAKNRYTTLSNDVLCDNRLSLKAKGLVAYLMSKPDGWKPVTKAIAQECEDGKASINNAMKQLIKLGYARRSKSQDEKGHWSTITEVADYQAWPEEIDQIEQSEADSEKPRNRFTDSGKTDSGKPVPLVSTIGVSTVKPLDTLQTPEVYLADEASADQPPALDQEDVPPSEDLGQQASGPHPHVPEDLGQQASGPQNVTAEDLGQGVFPFEVEDSNVPTTCAPVSEKKSKKPKKLPKSDTWHGIRNSLLQVLGWDIALIGGPEHKNISGFANRLEKKGYTGDDILRWHDEHWMTTWPGNLGGRQPKLRDIRERIAQVKPGSSEDQSKEVEVLVFTDGNGEKFVHIPGKDPIPYEDWQS